MPGASPEAIGTVITESVMWFLASGAIRTVITELVVLSAGIGLMLAISPCPFLMSLGMTLDRVESILVTPLILVLMILPAVLPHLRGSSPGVSVPPGFHSINEILPGLSRETLRSRIESGLVGFFQVIKELIKMLEAFRIVVFLSDFLEPLEPGKPVSILLLEPLGVIHL